MKNAKLEKYKNLSPGNQSLIVGYLRAEIDNFAQWLGDNGVKNSSLKARTLSDNLHMQLDRDYYGDKSQFSE